jgi:hypothetical protein
MQHTVLSVPGLNITRTKRNAEIVTGKILVTSKVTIEGREHTPERARSGPTRTTP